MSEEHESPEQTQQMMYENTTVKGLKNLDGLNNCLGLDDFLDRIEKSLMKMKIKMTNKVDITDRGMIKYY